MGPPPDREAPSTPSSAGPRAAERSGKIALVAGADAFAVWLLLSHFTGHIWLGASLLLVTVVSYLWAYRWDLVHDRAFLAVWVAVAIVGALLSLLVGPLNGLTDEPFLTPAFAGAWPNLYGVPVTVSYVQYGRPLTAGPVFNVYLPFLAFLEIPGVSYKWTALAAWAASLYLLRRRHEAVVLWGGLWVGVMAANGFNDFIPFLLLTLTFVSLTGPWSKLAEFVGLGVKQFANVVVVVVHLYRRRWTEAAVAVVVTLAILLPFAYLNAGGVWCHAVLIEATSCGGGAGPVFGVGVFTHLNYPLWLLYVAAVFGGGVVRALRAAPPVGWRGRAGALVRRWTPRASSATAAGLATRSERRHDGLSDESVLELGRRPVEERLEVHRVGPIVADQPVE
jgi:hypothetical protein